MAEEEKYNPYPDYKDERDTGQRRSGRTSRIVDFLVQEFFINGVAKCFDHYNPHGDNSDRRARGVQNIVLNRLLTEYDVPNKFIEVSKNNHIKNKSWPEN